jgi:hypothetical protein
MPEDRDTAWRAQIREGMTVLGMDGDALGRVFEVGDRALALERGAFLPNEWTASFTEVERVDEHGVWLRHGRASLERVSDAFCGPTDAYREAAEASPIHQWSGFRPPAVTHEEVGHSPTPTDEPSESSPEATDPPLIPGQNPPYER